MRIPQDQTYLGVITALLLCTATSAAALGIGTCDPTKDLCITISTDKTIPPQTPIKSSLSYDVGVSHSQVDSYEWLNPNDNYAAVSLPVDLLTKAQIKNLNFKISEVNHLPLANCSVKTPVGKKLMPGMLTLHLSYNVQTADFQCTP